MLLFTKQRLYTLAFALLALGKAGQRPTLKAFLNDQLSNNGHTDETRATASANFWWRLFWFLGATVAMLWFAQLSWGTKFVISTAMMMISGLLFLFGWKVYYYKTPTGSVLIVVYRVLKAAILRRHLEYPSTSSTSTKFNMNDSDEDGLPLMPRVRFLRWLDKAAIEETSSVNQLVTGNLCTFKQVKEVKLLFRTAPMWTTFLVYCLVCATGSTFFFEQEFTISSLYELLIPKLWPPTSEQRLAMQLRIGAGMLCSFLAIFSARQVEIFRLGLFAKGLITEHETVRMCIFWLIPQFCLLGLMKGLVEEGMVDFFYSQVTESMRSYGTEIVEFILGIGNFLSICWLLTFKSWFGETLNESHLDNYYGIIAVLCVGNIILYCIVSHNYEVVRKECDSHATKVDRAIDSNRSRLMSSNRSIRSRSFREPQSHQDGSMILTMENQRNNQVGGNSGLSVRDTESEIRTSTRDVN
ncbi:hypothetical protein F0562_007497 [Nyssa sinensis]|uniref:Uncharacterized protein n=1 Tax=Nyssa sinensis TaxID=561372 RepID=A0A5J5A867_9ASTE|nr:hypothetical protein F0562_007497 [Nyssa sinensis]